MALFPPAAIVRQMATRVLVVEDDLLNRMFYHDVLAAHGFEVKLVGDGGEVMAAALDFAPDLVTMDIQLPTISGLELIRRMQNHPRLRHVPILAITAFAGKNEERAIRTAGARGYLAKPVTVANLLAALEAIAKPD